MSNTAKRQQKRRDAVKKQGFVFKTICVHEVDLVRFDEFMQTLVKPIKKDSTDDGNCTNSITR